MIKPEFKLEPIKIPKDAMVGIGRVIVLRYFNRMQEGWGIDSSGNLISHPPFSKNYKIRPSGAMVAPPRLIDSGNRGRSMVSSFKVFSGKSTAKKVIMGFRSLRHPFSSLKTDQLAAIHHFGSPKINLPPSPHVGFSNDDGKEALKEFSNLMKALVERMTSGVF